MPEQLLGRIIRSCSEEGAIVLDPFSGSATTLAVAKKLGRRYVGFDISAEYVKLGLARLASIRTGDPLDGAPDPRVSAPSTRNGKPLADGKRPERPRRKRRVPAEQPIRPMLFERPAGE
jgi:site-specific DNA-methyltransferase (adenine-specific)